MPDRSKERAEQDAQDARDAAQANATATAGAPPDLSAMKAELLAEVAAGMPSKKEYKQEQMDAARAAVLYFRSLSQSPWLPVVTDDVIRHMAALAEIVATDMGHTVDASFIAGRTGAPHERAPGKDDLPESRR